MFELNGKFLKEEPCHFYISFNLFVACKGRAGAIVLNGKGSNMTQGHTSIIPNIFYLITIIKLNFK